MLGRLGAFKMCHPANLTILNGSIELATPSILDQPKIIAKRWYYRTVNIDTMSSSISCKISGWKQLAVKDELVKMLDKANCLYWVTSLMALVYDFINNSLHCLDKSSNDTIHIPQLHIVASALAVPVDAKEHNGIYLLEEHINGSFVKYINNNSITPRPHLTSSEHAIAKFLCFVQHVQYHLSGGLVFISDFQGI